MIQLWGETLIVLSLDLESNLFLFNLNRWTRSANAMDHVPGSMVQMTQPQPRRFDPITILIAGLVMIGIVALVGYLPERRAMRVDPIVALRGE